MIIFSFSVGQPLVVDTETELDSSAGINNNNNNGGGSTTPTGGGVKASGSSGNLSNNSNHDSDENLNLLQQESKMSGTATPTKPPVRAEHIALVSILFSRMQEPPQLMQPLPQPNASGGNNNTTNRHSMRILSNTSSQASQSLMLPRRLTNNNNNDETVSRESWVEIVTSNRASRDSEYAGGNLV